MHERSKNIPSEPNTRRDGHFFPPLHGPPTAVVAAGWTTGPPTWRVDAPRRAGPREPSPPPGFPPLPSFDSPVRRASLHGVGPDLGPRPPLLPSVVGSLAFLRRHLRAPRHRTHALRLALFRSLPLPSARDVAVVVARGGRRGVGVAASRDGGGVQRGWRVRRHRRGGRRAMDLGGATRGRGGAEFTASGAVAALVSLTGLELALLVGHLLSPAEGSLAFLLALLRGGLGASASAARALARELVGGAELGRGGAGGSLGGVHGEGTPDGGHLRGRGWGRTSAFRERGGGNSFPRFPRPRAGATRRRGNRGARATRRAGPAAEMNEATREMDGESREGGAPCGTGSVPTAGSARGRSTRPAKCVLMAVAGPCC